MKKENTSFSPNPTYHYDVVQGTPEWDALRLGCVTGSPIRKILGSKTKSERKTYFDDLLAERVTGQSTPQKFYSDAMRRGSEFEECARALHGLKTGNVITEVGFISHNELAHAVGVSPDGLVNENGTIEIKTVKNSIQIATIRSGSIPSSHMPQIQCGLWVSGREYCDFISYAPDAGTNWEYWTTRVERDEELIWEISSRVYEFVKELDQAQNDLMMGSHESLVHALEESIKKVSK